MLWRVLFIPKPSNSPNHTLHFVAAECLSYFFLFLSPALCEPLFFRQIITTILHPLSIQQTIYWNGNNSAKLSFNVFTVRVCIRYTANVNSSITDKLRYSSVIYKYMHLFSDIFEVCYNHRQISVKMIMKNNTLQKNWKFFDVIKKV